MVRPHVALLLPILLVGCKHTGPPLKDLPPPSVANTGWTTAFDKESGVSIAIPPGWRQGLPRAMTASSLMPESGEGGAPNPDLQNMMNDFAKQDAHDEKVRLADMREKQGIVLHCVDGSKPTIGEEPTRIYVKKIPDANYGSLDDAAVAEQQDVHQSMTKTAVDLPVGKAMRLTAKGQNRIGDVECHVSYVFLDGPDVFVLRMASTNNPDAIMSIEKAVAQTFRAKPHPKK